MSEEGPLHSDYFAEHEMPFRSRLEFKAGESGGQSDWDELLEKNPGKTAGELLSAPELKKYLDGHRQWILEKKDQIENDPTDLAGKDLLDFRIKELAASEEYLNQIGRLEEIQNLPPETTTQQQ